MRMMLVGRCIADQRPGGMPHVTSDRAEALAAAGVDVHLVTTSYSSKAGIEFAERQEQVKLNLTKWFTSTPAHDWSREFAEVCDAMYGRLQPDVVHLDSFDRDHPWWTGVKATKAITMHGFGWGAFLTKWNQYRITGGALEPDWAAIKRERDALVLADVVIGVSRHEHRMLRDQYALPKAKLVYNPIPAYFFEWRPQAKRSGFLCVAVSQGGTRGFETARRAALQAGVELRVLTSVPRAKLPAEYARSLAVVLPTAFAQGYDLSIAEARACGTPAIMAATGSYLDEACPHDVLVDTGDVDGLTAAMRRVAAEPRVLPGDIADAHRPERHAAAWLEAVGC